MERYEDFLRYKITGYDSIRYVKDITCPNCGKSGYGSTYVIGVGYKEMKSPKLIGWCETPQGLMMVHECPECFTKFRFHNCTTERNSLEKFKESFFLKMRLQTAEERF